MEKEKSVKQQALDELKADIIKEAKDKLKSKMRQLHLAKQAVANIQRELVDLEEEMNGKINEL